MALTEKRRNEIAWLFFLRQLRNWQKKYSALETCVHFSSVYRIPNDKHLRLAVESGFYEIIFSDNLITSEKVLNRNELTWLLHILAVYKAGIKIGENFNRGVGNAAVKIEVVGINEVREYYTELVAVISSLLSKNIWWQTFNDPSLRLKILRAIVAETRASKVNSAVASF